MSIENYKCNDCKLEFRAKKMISYSCPNCGGFLFPVNDKCSDKLDHYVEEMDEKKFDKVEKELSGIEKFLTKPYIKEIATSVKKLVDVLMKEESLELRSVAGAALLYLFSPIDLIPDLTPIVGFSDDAAVILMAVQKIIQATDYVDKNYNFAKKRKYQLSRQLFHIIHQDSELVYNYDEGNSGRIWTLSVRDAKHHNYKVMESSFIKAPEVYVRHPYLSDTLVPANNYDVLLAESMIKEQMNIASMLGAKSVHFNVKEQIKKLGGNKLNFDTNIKVKVSAEAKTEKLSVSESTKEYFDEYTSFEDINTEMLNNIFWYFTNEATFNDLVEQRIFRNIKRKKLSFAFKSENLMDVDTRAKLSRKNQLGVKVDFSDCITREIEATIEFFDLPQSVLNNKEAVYNEIIEKIENRKKYIELYDV